MRDWYCTRSRIGWSLILLLYFITLVELALPGFNCLALVTATQGAMVAFALIHGWSRYGLPVTVGFFVLCFAVSSGFENLSIATGFPFGHYDYASVLGPKLLHVPIAIGFAYFGTGYVAWMMACVLSCDRTLHNKAHALIATPLIATCLMLVWDGCLDPLRATLQKWWIWQQGGIYFGVPLTNFVGWFVTVYAFFQLFALYLSHRPGSVRPVLDRAYWSQPAMLFSLLALQFPLDWRSSVYDGVVTDMGGHAWVGSDILSVSTMLALGLMLPISALTLALVHKPGASWSNLGQGFGLKI